MDTFLNSSIGQSMIGAAGLVITALLGWLLNEIRRRTGAELRVAEATEITLLRAQLAEAMANGIAAAEAHMPITASQSSKVESVVAYVQQALPDAVTKLEATPSALAKRAEAELAKVEVAKG
jgi:hypothetical protein